MPKNDKESAKNECQACGRAFKTRQGLLGHSQVHRGSGGRRQYRIVGKETGFLHPDGTSRSYPSSEAIRQLIGLHEKGSGQKFSLSREEKEERFANPVEVTAPEKGQVSVRGGVPADEAVPVAVPRSAGDPPKGRRYDEDEKEKSSARRKLPTVVPTGSWSKWPTITWHGHTFIVENFESGSPKFKTPLLPTLFGCRPGENPEDQFASPDGRFVVGGKVFRFTPDAKKVLPDFKAGADYERDAEEKSEAEEADEWPFFTAIGFDSHRKKRLAGSTPALVGESEEQGAERP